MNYGELVSVIVPTFNAESTIDRCLESVVNQSYENLEIICCDDCSTDNTYDKLMQWSQVDSRIKVFKNSRNSRAAYTRNKCIEHSNGEIIVQIDDDDYCVLNRVEKLVNFMLNNEKYAIVGSKMHYFDENGVYELEQKKDFTGYEPKKKDFLRGSVFSNPSVAFRSTAIKAVGGYRVARETRRGQDFDLFMRMYQAGFKGYILPDKLVYYYRGKNSFPKCKYEYRIDEARIRFKNYCKLGLMPHGLIYAIKPLIVGLIPIELVEKAKRKLGTKRQ